MSKLALLLFAGLALAAMPAKGQTPEPRAKQLQKAADPAKDGVPIGKVTTGGMVFELAIEGAEAMCHRSG